MRFESTCKPSGRNSRPYRRESFLWIPLLPALLLFAACSTGDGHKILNDSDKRLVLFTFSVEAKSVCLSGEFNDWSPDSRCLKKKGDRWEIEIPLGPGRYRYGFLVEGTEWVLDPGALMNEEDGFGKKNSVLVVQ